MNRRTAGTAPTETCGLVHGADTCLKPSRTNSGSTWAAAVTSTITFDHLSLLYLPWHTPASLAFLRPLPFSWLRMSLFLFPPSLPGESELTRARARACVRACVCVCVCVCVSSLAHCSCPPAAPPAATVGCCSRFRPARRSARLFASAPEAGVKPEQHWCSCKTCMPWVGLESDPKCLLP